MKRTKYTTDKLKVLKQIIKNEYSVVDFLNRLGIPIGLLFFIPGVGNLSHQVKSSSAIEYLEKPN